MFSNEHRWLREFQMRNSALRSNLESEASQKNSPIPSRHRCEDRVRVQKRRNERAPDLASIVQRRPDFRRPGVSATLCQLVSLALVILLADRICEEQVEEA